MPLVRIRDAARIAGVGRSTLDRALRSGRLSCEVDEHGHRWVDPSELARAFAETARPVPRDSPGDAWGRAPGSEIEAERAARVAALEAQVRDLQRRLDAADEERRALTQRLLGPPDQPAPGPWWRRWWR